jgi:hypothetical protein
VQCEVVEQQILGNQPLDEEPILDLGNIGQIVMFDFYGLGQASPAPFHPGNGNADDAQEDQGGQDNGDAWPQDAQEDNNPILQIENGIDLNQDPEAQ